MNKTFISKRQVTRKTKLNQYKNILTLTYGTESWIMPENMESGNSRNEILGESQRSNTKFEIIPVTEFIGTTKLVGTSAENGRKQVVK